MEKTISPVREVRSPDLATAFGGRWREMERRPKEPTGSVHWLFRVFVPSHATSPAQPGYQVRASMAPHGLQGEIRGTSERAALTVFSMA